MSVLCPVSEEDQNVPALMVIRLRSYGAGGVQGRTKCSALNTVSSWFLKTVPYTLSSLLEFSEQRFHFR